MAASGGKRQVFASVWDALEDSPAEATTTRLRSELVTATRQALAAWDIAEASAGRWKVMLAGVMSLALAGGKIWTSANR